MVETETKKSAPTREQILEAAEAAVLAKGFSGTSIDELIASICCHEQLFDREVREINEKAVLGWRKRFRDRLERVADRYPPRIPVGLDDLADMLSVVADGGIILSKATKDPASLPRQLLLYRDFIRLVFSPLRPDAYRRLSLGGTQNEWVTNSPWTSSSSRERAMTVSVSNPLQV